MSRSRRAAFLDRDGVLNERPPAHHYLTSAHDFAWLPGAADAVVELQAAGFMPIVVSNQRGIARGLVSWPTLQAIEESIQSELAARGGRVEAFYYCPHDLDAGCDCRKPAPGMLLAAAREHDLELSESVVVGDEESDVEAGKRAGCFTIRVGDAGHPTSADARADDLASAVVEIVLPRWQGRASSRAQ